MYLTFQKIRKIWILVMLVGTLVSVSCTSSPDLKDSGAVDSGAVDSGVVDSGVVAFKVRINELMAKNDATLADESGSFDDWVELYNAGDAAVSLKDWSLSDIQEQLKLYNFSADQQIEAHGYLLVWLDNDSEEGILHAPFKLKSGGESIFLSFKGEIQDQVTFPELLADQSYGVGADGSWKILNKASPNDKNE